jgi:hypothetical protein
MAEDFEAVIMENSISSGHRKTNLYNVWFRLTGVYCCVKQEGETCPERKAGIRENTQRW